MDRREERAALTVLKNKYEEYLLNINKRVEEIDKEQCQENTQEKEKESE